MSDLAYPLDFVRGVPVVTAPEEIDITNADKLRGSLLEAAAHGHATLVVDLSRTLFCDTAGLNVLVRLHKHAVAEGGELRLVIPSVPILRAFAVAGVDRVIPHFPTLDEALAPTPAATIRLRRGLSRGHRILTDLLVPDGPEPGAPRVQVHRAQAPTA
jgi:anti-sigma B factor antagonist